MIPDRRKAQIGLVRLSRYAPASSRSRRKLGFTSMFNAGPASRASSPTTPRKLPRISTPSARATSAPWAHGARHARKQYSDPARSHSRSATPEGDATNGNVRDESLGKSLEAWRSSTNRCALVNPKNSPGPFVGRGTAEGRPRSSYCTDTGRKYVIACANLIGAASGTRSGIEGALPMAEATAGTM